MDLLGIGISPRGRGSLGCCLRASTDKIPGDSSSLHAKTESLPEIFDWLFPWYLCTLDALAMKPRRDIHLYIVSYVPTSPSQLLRIIRRSLSAALVQSHHHFQVSLFSSGPFRLLTASFSTFYSSFPGSIENMILRSLSLFECLPRTCNAVHCPNGMSS